MGGGGGAMAARARGKLSWRACPRNVPRRVGNSWKIQFGKTVANKIPCSPMLRPFTTSARPTAGVVGVCSNYLLRKWTIVAQSDKGPIFHHFQRSQRNILAILLKKIQASARVSEWHKLLLYNSVLHFEHSNFLNFLYCGRCWALSTAHHHQLVPSST